MGESDPAERDVDARFLLANDRTLLAWVRTALTLAAVGVGLLQFGQGPGRRVPAAVLLALATAAAATGLLRYRSADRALRAGELPQTGVAPTALAATVVVLCGALVVAALLGGLGR